MSVCCVGTSMYTISENCHVVSEVDRNKHTNLIYTHTHTHTHIYTNTTSLKHMLKAKLGNTIYKGASGVCA